MISKNIPKIFQQKVAEKIKLIADGENKYIVYTPFILKDGDHLPILLKQDNKKRWYLSDEGHTLTIINRKENAQIINKILNFYRIQNVEGELKVYIENENYGVSFYNFIQALIEITGAFYPPEWKE
jgi:hypothetical protein